MDPLLDDRNDEYFDTFMGRVVGSDALIASINATILLNLAVMCLEYEIMSDDSAEGID